jgi:hypothetical protein
MNARWRSLTVRPNAELVKQHLAAFARSFVRSEQAERYETLAASPRGLQKWRDGLDHFQKRLRPELAEPIPPGVRDVESICKLVGRECASTEVVVFSTNSRLSAGVGDLATILDDVIQTDMGAIVSISSGDLAIYWGEERDARFLLRAKQVHVRLKIRAR